MKCNYLFFDFLGDVVGPGMFEKYLDALNVLRRPTGCGEPYMFDFAVNLYTLKYLKATSQLSETILLNALDYMNIGRYIVGQGTL